MKKCRDCNYWGSEYCCYNREAVPRDGCFPQCAEKTALDKMEEAMAKLEKSTDLFPPTGTNFN